MAAEEGPPLLLAGRAAPSPLLLVLVLVLDRLEKEQDAEQA
jgi:hypothetical protein